MHHVFFVVVVFFLFFFVLPIGLTGLVRMVKNIIGENMFTLDFRKMTCQVLGKFWTYY